MNDIIRNKRIKEFIKTKKDKQKERRNQEVDSVENIAKDTVSEASKRTADIIHSKHIKTSKTNTQESFEVNVNKKIRNNINASKRKYEDRIRHIYINKQKKNRTKSYNTKKKLTEKIIDVIQNSFTFIKKSVTTLNSLIYASTGMILIVVITLFLGIFASLSDHSVTGTSFIKLSDEVLAYNEIIYKYADQYEIGEYVPLIQAIMMVESKGLGNDPMDVSNLLNRNIDNPEESIQEGIKYLSTCLEQANVNSPNDTDQLFLAIQGYDSTIDYINWALDNFDGYSKSNAQIYYDEHKIGNANYVNHVMQYIGFDFGTFRLTPNFDNNMAWGYNNPYSRSNLYGQCTWFAWGRFYELYGFDPGFTGDGWDCARQLVEAHPDKFELSSSPQIGSIYSCIGRNHVGIVVGWDGTNITIQEGNLDSQSNTFEDAKGDWHTVTYDIDTFRMICDGVVFAVQQ